MTSPEQYLMGPSGQIESFMASIRKNGGGTYEGNYQDQTDGIGSYNIKPQNWRAYAVAAGLPKANWRDPRAQDAVARGKIQRDFERYGNWQLVAVAWYAGNEAADAVHQSGGVDDNSIRRILGDDTADFVTETIRNGSEIERSEWGPASGNSNLMSDSGMTTPGTKKQAHSETRPEQMVRERLQNLAGMNGTPPADLSSVDQVTDERSPQEMRTAAQATTLPVQPDMVKDGAAFTQPEVTP